MMDHNKQNLSEWLNIDQKVREDIKVQRTVVKGIDINVYSYMIF